MVKDNFNFIPAEYILKEKTRKQKKMFRIFLPIVIVMLIIPVWLIYSDNIDNQEKITQLLEEQGKLENRVQELEPVETKIAEFEKKISVFSDLFSNSYKRVINIRNIEKYIPSEIVYTQISLVFSDYKKDLSEEEVAESEATPDAAQDQASLEEDSIVKIYENVPNIMVIEGRTERLDSISRFVYKLNRDPLIEVVNMEEIGWLTEEKMNSFLITAEIKEDVLK